MISFEDLYNNRGLSGIDREFQKFLLEKNFELHDILVSARVNGNFADRSNAIIEVSKYLELFITEIFEIQNYLSDLKEKYKSLENIYFVRRNFIQRIVAVKYRNPEGSFEEMEVRIEAIIGKNFTQLEFADFVVGLMNLQSDLELVAQYSAFILFTDFGIDKRKWVLFSLPKKELLNYETCIDDGLVLKKSTQQKNREGFSLTDKKGSDEEILVESKYCIICHNQSKDFCKKGRVDLVQVGSDDNYIKPINHNQIPLTTENEERTNEVQRELSEKNKDSANSLLGVGEYYNKREVEGGFLTGCPVDEDISEMIYLKSQNYTIAALAVIMINNPLVAVTGHRICNDCMKSCIYTPKQNPVNIPKIETKILDEVLALPFGFEIYSLLTRWNPLNPVNYLPKNPSRRKILVVGMGPAGFAISHYLLNEGHEIVGIDGMKIEKSDDKSELIKNFITEDLAERVIDGFGGVMEYGITVRWDKNYLKIIRLILERRSGFTLLGGVRFGGAVDIESAFGKFGFDHLALCLGSGKSKIVDIKNIQKYLGKNVYLSSDFLMSLHLSGAFQQNSTIDFGVESPILVIGAGLTAIDVATEAKAYCEKKTGKKAKVVILYRKSMQNSPAYRINHEELQNCLNEGVEFLENIIPLEIFEYGRLKCSVNDEEKILPFGTMILASGTMCNISLRENDDQPLQISEDGCYKTEEDGFTIFRDAKLNKAVTIFGDMNKKYHGSVIKAIASVKHGVGIVNKHLEYASNVSGTSKIQDIAYSKIVKIKRLRDDLVEMDIESPLLAEKTRIGHIFRFQVYIREFGMNIEPVVLTACDVNGDVIKFYIMSLGKSTKFLVENLHEGQEVVLVGPSGKEIPKMHGKKILIIAADRGVMPASHIANEWKKDNEVKMMGLDADLSNYLATNKLDLVYSICNETNARIIEEIVEKFDVRHLVNMPVKMQCVMQGICCRCIRQKPDGLFVCACSEQDWYM